jgi:thiol-disulfide isomerase/thioredoxin
MNNLFVAVVLVGLVLGTGGADKPNPAQDQKAPAKKGKTAVSLKVGDSAPALKVSKWLQGQEVKSFEPGKVYVVEFWATWCGPCIAFMPHLAELQTQYKSEGVTIIGFTARDPNNPEKQVAAFVKKRGPKLKYTFAYDDNRTTYDAWMQAAGRTGIPCTFVVDKTGRIAYVGHPMYLGVVLPKVVAGNANGQAISDEVARIEADRGAVNEALNRDPMAGLQALKEFEAKYPLMAHVMSARIKLSYLPRFGKVGEAKEFAEAMVAKAIKHDDSMSLAMVSSILRLGDGKESKELLAVAVKAAEARVRMDGDGDAGALIDLADTYFVAGDKARAREFARKAAEAAAGEPAALRRYIDQQARMFADEKKEDKK